MKRGTGRELRTSLFKVEFLKKWKRSFSVTKILMRVEAENRWR
jgi:hypothetical protein